MFEHLTDLIYGKPSSRVIPARARSFFATLLLNAVPTVATPARHINVMTVHVIKQNQTLELHHKLGYTHEKKYGHTNHVFAHFVSIRLYLEDNIEIHIIRYMINEIYLKMNKTEYLYMQ